MEAKKQIWGVGENMGTEESKKIWEENAQFWDNAMGDESYACPSVIAVNKETAEIIAKNLKSAGGKFELVFTRNENGRKELFKCRKYSYINANSKLVKNKKIVK